MINSKYNSTEIEKKLSIAQELLERGHYGSVIDILEEFSDKDIGDTRVLLLLGMANLEIWNISAATNHICNAIEINKNSSELYRLLSISMSKINKYYETGECLVKAIEIDPDNENLKHELEIANICAEAIRNLNLPDLELLNSFNYFEISEIANKS